MIKKLMSFIFEEETIEETPEEVKEKPVEIKETKMPEKKEAKILDDEKESEPAEKTAANPEKKDQSVLDKMKVEAAPAPVVAKAKKPVVTNKPEYEFTPVISPIYGIADEKKVQSTPHVQKKTYTSSSTPTGIVLSPINGNLKEEKPEKAEVQVEKPALDISEEMISDDPIVDIPLSSMLDHHFPDLEEEELPVVEAKEVPNDKKVLLSKNLSLFDDEE